MINYLKNIKKETLIGQLPDIINSNNESLRNEFDWYFDSSLNRLKRSVYAPTGSVKAHFGEFVNLSCEYLTIKNEESIKNSIQSAVELVIADSFDPSTKQLTNHNILNNRFVDSQYEGTTEYVHDAAAIVYEKENSKYITVKDTLDNIDASLDGVYEVVKRFDSIITEFDEEIKDKFIQQNTSINEIENDINDINSNIEIINTSINSDEENIQNLNNKANSLFTEIENISSNIQTINSSINNINKNNIISDVDDYNYQFEPTQNNIIDAEINEGDILNIKFVKDDLWEYEYKFSFIIKPEVTTMYFCILDIELNEDDIYINNNENEIQYNGDSTFTITKNPEDNILYNIKFNRYQKKSDEKMVTILKYEKYYLI